MILVDTSVWVAHLRAGSNTLRELLEAGDVLCHSFVIGELACGTLHDRVEILRLLSALPRAPSASNGEVLAFIESARLHGRGLGWIDVHLLAAARLASVRLWTLDRSLARAGVRLGMSWDQPR